MQCIYSSAGLLSNIRSVNARQPLDCESLSYLGMYMMVIPPFMGIPHPAHVEVDKSRQREPISATHPAGCKPTIKMIIGFEVSNPGAPAIRAPVLC